MKKMNNRGFLLIETLTVATFSITVLVLLFVYFKDLITTYNNSYNYNTVEGIYNARTIKEYLEQNGNLSSLSGDLANPSIDYANNEKYSLKLTYTDLGAKGFVNTSNFNTIIGAANVKTVIFTSSNLTNLKKQILEKDVDGITEDMINFIKRLDNKYSRNRLIVEYNDGTFATVTFGYVSG